MKHVKRNATTLKNAMVKNQKHAKRNVTKHKNVKVKSQKLAKVTNTKDVIINMNTNINMKAAIININ